MASNPVVIVGAGIGGLACAIDLAVAGIEVLVLEKAEAPGGKMREIVVDGRPIDSGPTVFTMRWVFDALFEAAGATLDSALTLTPARILARHAWDEAGHLDLHADIDASAEAIGAFSGVAEAAAFRRFCAEAATIYRTLKDTFLTASRPGPFTLSRRIGLHRPGALLAIRPFDTMWRALGVHFKDPRLRQLFGRYATYCGSSPFLAPATLMLIAHVEQEGVYLVEGGMQRLAEALRQLAEQKGVQFRFEAEVREIVVDRAGVQEVVLIPGERIASRAVVWNGDASALATGLAGAAVRRAAKPVEPKDRSLSAITWSMAAETSGFALLRHNVFFGGDYETEFDDLLARRLPRDPTVYVCAHDRGAVDGALTNGRERLLVLSNAPADGDEITAEEIASCARRSFDRLRACGLLVDQASASVVTTTPGDFNRLFPATGGALYGRASHGWMASFQRPGSRTAVPGLYLAGGSAHPGAGVPMAALSGRLAAQALVTDLRSTRRSRPAGISGGTSMRSAKTGAMR